MILECLVADCADRQIAPGDVESHVAAHFPGAVVESNGDVLHVAFLVGADAWQGAA